MVRSAHLIRPVNDMSSSKIDIPLDTTPLPTLTVRAIFGLTRFAASRGVISCKSFGVNETAQSIVTISSGLAISTQPACVTLTSWGTCGHSQYEALWSPLCLHQLPVPWQHIDRSEDLQVNVVILILSTNPGVEAASAESTLATIV